MAERAIHTHRPHQVRVDVRVSPQSSEDFRALRVLVVEDELLIRWSIAETLAHDGHTVIEAGDAAGAIRAIETDAEPIDAIVLDYRLPDSNDFRLLATIRRLSPASAVVMMTAVGTPDMLRGAFDLGVHDVLHKPFELTVLAPLLRSACDRR